MQILDFPDEISKIFLGEITKLGFSDEDKEKIEEALERSTGTAIDSFDEDVWRKREHERL